MSVAERARAGAAARRARLPPATLTLALGAALAAIAFGAGGGLQLARTTTVELLVTLAGAALVVVAIVRAERPARPWGAVTLLLLAVLAAFTAFSVVWAIQPSDAWLEANRTFAYLAAFAGAIALARLAPRRVDAPLGGVLIASLLVSAFALASKVVPRLLYPDETYARLREPFGYWNAVGLMAALGVPVCLWLGTRAEGSRRLRQAAYPALGLLLVTVLLAYSRGSIIAIVLGVACWLATAPTLRLRSLAVLGAATVGAGAVAAWAFAQDGLSKDRMSLAARADAGIWFGLVLVAALVALYLAGRAIEARAERAPLAAATQRRIGRGLLIALALTPVVALGALAASSRGLGGSISHGWRSLTSERSTATNDPSRLAGASNARGRYWRQAFRIWSHDRLLGIGAGGFATAQPRYRRDPLKALHAHGYIPQTLADLGLVGLAVSLALLASWLAAATRAAGLRRRDRALPYDAERVGVLALVAVVVVFGVHSLLDFTWFIPGTAVAALVCAAWVASRGPLVGVPVGRPAAAPEAKHSRLAAAIGAEPARVGAAIGVAALALVAAFAIWQPQRAVHAGDSALAELAAGRIPAARASALTARDRNPLAVEPLFDLAAVEQRAGARAEALRWLERAVALQPANPEPWRQLAAYRLTAGQARPALDAARAALALDPWSTLAQAQFLTARRLLAAPPS